mmetsp:Transcript_6158/g.11191  ORF Transcript_6158/g.11191 Transcript_6158/m.11191 type:complete len:220 (-) Transcript_6158:569-1228(-)
MNTTFVESGDGCQILPSSFKTFTCTNTVVFAPAGQAIEIFQLHAIDAVQGQWSAITQNEKQLHTSHFGKASLSYRQIEQCKALIQMVINAFIHVLRKRCFVIEVPYDTMRTFKRLHIPGFLLLIALHFLFMGPLQGCKSSGLGLHVFFHSRDFPLKGMIPILDEITCNPALVLHDDVCLFVCNQLLVESLFCERGVRTHKPSARSSTIESFLILHHILQ